jgi:hypothetical protein
VYDSQPAALTHSEAQMTVKLKIDLSQGQLELEGSDDAVLKIYEDFMSKVDGLVQSRLPVAQNVEPPSRSVLIEAPLEAEVEVNASKKKKSSSTKKTSYSKVDEIYKGQHAVKIKEFYEKFDVKSHSQKVVIFIYCMQNEINITGIGINHIYTCYLIANTPTPNVLPQAIRDAKTALDYDDWSDLKVTSIGENAVLHHYAKKQVAEQ